MKRRISVEAIPWTIVVLFTVLLSYYANQLDSIQFYIHIYSSNHSYYPYCSKSIGLRDNRQSVHNSTNSQLSTFNPILSHSILHNQSQFTPRQLKDFGKYAVNRKNTLSFFQIEYDYKDIVYPVPFNKLVSDISNRYVNYAAKIPSAPYIITGDIPQFDNQTSEVLMMTGASDNHALGSFNCLYSMILADPYASYLYIDLGLSPKFKNVLLTHFNTIHQIQVKMNSTGFVAYRRFKFSSFPRWVRLAGNKSQRGGYAWKVIPLIDAYFAWKGILFWLDGGSLIRDGISRELTNARLEGIYSPYSAFTQKKFTYPATAHFLVNHHLIDRFYPDDLNGSGGHLIIDWSNKTVLNRVMIPYYQCAFTQKCISPRGSNMKNHRQDQAVISAFLSNINTTRSINMNCQALPGLRLENNNNAGKCRALLGNELNTIQNTFQIKIVNHYLSTDKIKYSRIVTKYSSRPVDKEWNPSI